jgi:hypothetical protein
MTDKTLKELQEWASTLDTSDQTNRVRVNLCKSVGRER